MADLSRDEYAGRYGPTTDDRLRLGETDLWVRVEDDHVPVAVGHDMVDVRRPDDTGPASDERAPPAHVRPAVDANGEGVVPSDCGSS